VQAARAIVTPGGMVRVTMLDELPPGTEWIQGKLVFYHVPVSTVLATLSRWYGYQFQYADSALAQRSVTVAVTMQSPSTAFATLEEILRVNMMLAGDTVTLTPQPVKNLKRHPYEKAHDVWTPSREVGR